MQLNADNNEFSVSARPESHVFDSVLDTGLHAADSVNFAAVEGALTWNALMLQTEWGRQFVAYSALPAAKFDAGYLSASWVATGERRSYNTATGTFGGITPARGVSDGGWGAWEIGLRYSHMDLNDAAIEGGVGDFWTLGLTWYPAVHLRLMANWIYFDVDNANAAMPLGSPDHKGHGFGMRAQVDW